MSADDEPAPGPDLDRELDDLGDGDDEGRFEVRLGVLTEPVVQRSLIGLAIAFTVLLWPERTDLVLARLVGIGLVITRIPHLWALVRRRSTAPGAWLGPVAAVAAGVVLLVSPDRSTVFVVRLVALVLAGFAGSSLLDIATQAGAARRWPLVRSAALLATAGLLALYPAELLAWTTAMAAIGYGLMALIAVVESLKADDDEVYDIADAVEITGRWLDERPKSVHDRRALYDKVLYEGPEVRVRVVRFFTLMGFAAVIASTGVLADSTAVVIGAMLIAPLMTPLMAGAMSLVMGWPRRLGRAALIAGGGVVLTIAIGAFLGLIAPVAIDIGTNSQITSRVTPTTLDLITAVAAGAAGAYGLSRPDVSDSLPGVAVAIALVPPLSVVGIAYSVGEWGAGNGALLLFATNAVSILVVGGITFVLTGVTPISRVADNQHRVRTSVAAIAGLGVVVVGALLLNGSEVTQSAVEQRLTETTVEDWLADAPDHDLAQVRRSGTTVTAAIVGPSAGAPAAADLASRLTQALGRTMTAEVRLLIQELDVATGLSP